MNRISISKYILLMFMLLSGGHLVVHGSNVSSNVIWYAQPAKEWMEAIPIGNGRISGMVYGGIDEDRIALNEISLWSGKPAPEANNICGKDKLDEMRKAFFANDPEKGNALGEKYLNGTGKNFGTHLPLGDLVMKMSHPHGVMSGYRRQLNMDRGCVDVSYKCGGITYHRQYIADYPDNVIAIRFAASTQKSISMTLCLDLLREANVTSSGNDLRLDGVVKFPKLGEGGVSFYGDVRVMPHGGQIQAKNGQIVVEGADSLTILIDVRTNYNDSQYRQTCENTIDKASSFGYATLFQRHEADYTKLFSRMDISFGAEGVDSLPTDTRLYKAKHGVFDQRLDALFFQYGRYMLISSSRENGMPLCANLQGIWNDNGACNMPWTCDYHLDINIPQNYWSVNRVNLPECNTPLFDYISFLSKNGEATARQMYGCRGWVAHTVCNAWGYTSPGWGIGWGMNVTGGAWLATHLWSHYLYTQDKNYLKEVGYPLLKKTAMFFIDYMVKDPRNGYLVTGPSISPENSYVSKKGNNLSLSMMPTIDRAIVYYIYDACIKASKILDMDRAFRIRLEKDIKLLPPLQIGSDGQLREWLEDVHRSDPSHRHSSHLLSLFPLDEVSYSTMHRLMEAAKKSILTQTSSPHWEDTEWSTANMLCFFARLKEPETSYHWLQNLFKSFTRENLMTVSPAGIAGAQYDIFSFDATEASVAGMCEMLMQSYDGCIDFLPALPAEWSNGYVKGICAEGGLTVDMFWSNGRMTKAVFHASSDSHFKIKGIKENISIKKGETKVINF